MEGVHVRFHDVELWAPSAANLVGVAIVVVLASEHIVAILILTWHAHLIESCNAATLLATEVDVVGDRAAEDIWPIPAFWVKVVKLGKFATIGP